MGLVHQDVPYQEGQDGVPKDQLEILSAKQEKKEKKKKKRQDVEETFEEEKSSEIRDKPPPFAVVEEVDETEQPL